MAFIKLSRVKELVWNVEPVENERPDIMEYLTASQVDRNKEIELVTNRIDFTHHKNFIIFGLKNFKLIFEIYKRKTPFSTMVIVEITNEGTEEIHLDGDASHMRLFSDPRVNLIIGTENTLGRQIDLAFSDLEKIYNLKNIEILTMPYVKSYYPVELNNTLNALFEKLHSWIGAFGNAVEDILIGMDNYINNWRHVFRGLDCKPFGGVYKGKPAVIVGAGPSLDKNINLFTQLKDKALIFSVDGAMNTLFGKGIKPDIVSSIERIKLTTNFYNSHEIPEELIFVGPNVILKDILDKFNKIIFTGRIGDGLFNKFNEAIGFTNLEVGSNVSHILIAFAIYLECDPIIFTGLDLAYTGGRTHTARFSEYLDEDAMSIYKKNIVYVAGQNGEKLETNENFRNTKTWIESVIAQDMDRTYINATEGGAKIAGAINLKLSDVISQYFNNRENIERLTYIYDKIKEGQEIDKNKEDVTNKAMIFFEELKEYFLSINKKSESYYDKLFGSKKNGRVALMEKQRNEMDNLLNENSAGRFILQSVTISYNREIRSFPMQLNASDEKKMMERNLKYYKDLKAVSEKVTESIDVYIMALKSHLDTECYIGEEK